VKKTYFILLLLTSFAKGQSLYWDKYFQIGNSSPVTDEVVVLNDSLYLIRSHCTNTATPGLYNFGFLTVDKYGNQIQKKAICYLNVDSYWSNHSYENTIKMSASSSLFYNMNTYGPQSTLIFSKINNTTLDTIKNYYFSDNNYHYPGSIVKINSNKYLYFSCKTNTSTGNYFPHHFVLDSSMNFISSATYNYTNNIIAYNAKLNPLNKHIILCGNLYSSTSFDVSGGLIEADTLGNVINSLVNVHGSVNVFAQVFYSAYDNTYIGIGAYKSGEFGGHDLYRLYICKFNSTTLQPIWRKTYGSAQIINGLYDAVVNPDGSIIASGEYADSIPNMTLTNWNSNGVILKVNANGDSLWMRQYSNNYPIPNVGPYDEVLRSIEKTSNGGYIACGFMYGQPNAKSWVIKVDSLGCFNTSCNFVYAGVDEKIPESTFKIFPNPVNSKLNIEFISRSQAFSITDILGQILIEEKLTDLSREIDLSGLSKGIYFLNIQVDNRKQTFKIIKE
jgi:hypothetical protein